MKKNGFTLIEGMVAIVVAGILFSIAYPNYRDYVLRTKASTAINALSTMKTRMDMAWENNRTYEGACTPESKAPIATVEGFVMTCTELGKNSYQVVMEGQGFKWSLTHSDVFDENDQDKVVDKMQTIAVPEGWSLPPSTTVNSAGESIPNYCWSTSKDGKC